MKLAYAFFKIAIINILKDLQENMKMRNERYEKELK